MVLFNYNNFINKERSFDANVLFNEQVEVRVPVLSGVQSDDMFETPATVSEDVVTIECVFEYDVSERVKWIIGGAVLEGDAFILAEERWLETFKQDQAIVVRGTEEYLVTMIRRVNLGDSMIVSLKKRGER